MSPLLFHTGIRFCHLLLSFIIWHIQLKKKTSLLYCNLHCLQGEDGIHWGKFSLAGCLFCHCPSSLSKHSNSFLCLNIFSLEDWKQTIPLVRCRCSFTTITWSSEKVRHAHSHMYMMGVFSFHLPNSLTRLWSTFP